MTTFLDVVRKATEQRKQRDFIVKGGKGSGWFAPPKGTHTKGAKAKAKVKGKGKVPTPTHMKRAAKVNTIADRSPSELKSIAISSLLAAHGVTEDIRTQYRGVKGTQAQRKRLDARIKILDAELKRRGIKNPKGAVRERWPGWKPMGKWILTA